MTARGRLGPNAEGMFDAYQGGDSCFVVARRFGVTPQRVYQAAATVAERRGVALRPRLNNAGPRRTRYVVPTDLAEDYRLWRKRIPEIARLLGWHVMTVMKALKRQGVRRDRKDRPPSQRDRIYADFKAGATMPELAAKYQTTKGVVSQSIHQLRRKDAEPYYRRPKWRRL